MLFELIQIALGEKEKLSHTLSQLEWMSLYKEALKQSVVGVAFDGVQKLPKEQWPPQGLLFEWIGICEQIKAQNQLTYKRSVEISKLFADAGYRNCILKGQGNALMYPNPYSRMSGDIDIWVDGTRNEIRNYVRSKCPNAYEQSNHIDFKIFKDVEVEVHFNPCTLILHKQ